MKKFILVVMIFMIGTLVCSCEKTEDNTSSSEESGTQPSSVDSEIVYVTLDEARKEADELKGNKYLDFELPEKIVMPEGNTLGIYEVSCRYMNDYQADLECIKNLWDDYEKTENIEMLHIENEHMDENGKVLPKLKSILYVDDETEPTYAYSFTRCGKIMFESKKCSWTRFIDGSKWYDFNWVDKIPEKEGCELPEGYMSVAEAVGLVEERVNQHYSVLENQQFEYRVSELTLAENSSNDTPEYYMVISKVYNGTVIDTVGEFVLNDNKRIKKIIRGDAFTVIINEKNKISGVNATGYGGAKNIKEKEKTEKIISLKSALSLAKKEIATIGLENIYNAGLAYYYVLDPVYDEHGEVHADLGPDDTWEMRPLWLFAQKKPGENPGSALSGHGPSILVDAIDGTVYYFNTTA
ncbi:MAG: hypothetical protein IJM14_09935 [Lachnospiraceae bacterium]|nr:hypothetical protein [Lachnospiraceae bacterium]